MSHHAIAFQMMLRQQQQQQLVAQQQGRTLGSKRPLPPCTTNSQVDVVARSPASSPWSCEPCARAFVNEKQMKAHVESHVPCDHPDCDFEASKKVVSAHFHASHGMYSGTGYKTITVEGQRFRVLLGTSPEEVEEWRRERRNKWPSKKRMEEKLVQQREQNGSSSSPPCGEGVTHGSALSAIAQAYADSDVEEGHAVAAAESDQEDASELVNGREKVQAENFAPRKRLCKWHSRGACKYGEKCRFLHDGQVPRHARGTGASASRPNSLSKKGSLLSSLLSTEEKLETDITLACIRFLVCECMSVV